MEKTEKMCFLFSVAHTRHSDVVHLASQPTAPVRFVVRPASQRQNMLRSFDKLKIKYFTTQNLAQKTWKIIVTR